MLLTCPNCAAGYEVPDHLLDGPIRTLRCALCACEWPAHAPSFEAEPATLPPEEPPAPPPPPPRDDPPLLDALRITPEQIAALHESMELSRQRQRGMIGWALTLLVLALLAVSAVVWRHQLIGAWPPVTRVYHAVGLD
jgi:predicted Zn finger-like uncharacterized protein